MPLHPDDVVRKTFRTTQLRRGYDGDEVDSFLEEVVSELRRLRSEVDGQMATIDQLTSRLSHGDETSERRALEAQQLEQVRREREEVVRELQDADRRVAQARADAEMAECDRDRSLEEIRARFDDDLFALERRVHAAREEANRAEYESRARIATAREHAERAKLEEEQLGTHLAALRLKGEQALAEEVGADRVQELLSDLHVPEAADPMANLRIVAALFAVAHREHVERARVEADDILRQAGAERDRLIEEARVEYQRLLGEGRTEHDRLVAAGQVEHDRLLSEGQSARVTASSERAPRLLDEGKREHENPVGSVQAEHDRLVSEAEEHRAAVLADLQARQKLLESQIAELDRFQDEYRQRLRVYMTEQVRVLDDEGWHK